MAEVMLATISNKAFAEKFVKYLEYSEIPARLEDNVETEDYSVFVDEEKKDLAATHLSVFTHMEKQRLYEETKACYDLVNDLCEELDGCEEADDEEEEASSNRSSGGVYTSYDEVSKDMSQTAVTFFGFAVALVIITVLCALKVSFFAYFSNIIVLITLPVLAVGCVAVGLNSKKRQKLAESEAKEENEEKDAIFTWLKENVTKELITEKDDPEASLEIIYMNRTDFISEKLDEQFPDIDDAFKEAIIEEYYNGLFN